MSSPIFQSDEFLHVAGGKAVEGQRVERVLPVSYPSCTRRGCQESRRIISPPNILLSSASPSFFLLMKQRCLYLLSGPLKMWSVKWMLRRLQSGGSAQDLARTLYNPLFYQLCASSTLGTTNSCLRPWPPLPTSPVENQLGFKVSDLV